MKPLGHIALIAALMQLMGAGVCAPDQTQASHECCQPTQERTSAGDTQRSPQCCLVSTFREHEAITQTKAESKSLSVDLPMADRSPAWAVPSYHPNPFELWLTRHAASPPINPLQQTCLLLI